MWLNGIALLTAGGWLGLLALPWRPWSTRERLEPDVSNGSLPDLNAVTVLIPARNEAVTIARTLKCLARQGQGLRIVVIDDQSTDRTAELARAVNAPGLAILPGAPLPEGWSGKLWALQQGFGTVESPLVLLLDADIELLPGSLIALVRKLEAERLDVASVMAELPTESGWERLLVPAFVYFFKLLYPFALGNRRSSRLGVAAGGCMLARTERLRAMGGFAGFRQALIDDCALAGEIKRRGGHVWVGLSHAVKSHRPYPTLDSFWHMVARTAFTQLRYSPVLLAGTTMLMLVCFWAPWIAIICGKKSTRLAGIAGAVAMSASYHPMIRFYRLPWWRTLTLSGASFLYLLMTWSSALRYWKGQRSEWKGRVYVAAASRKRHGTQGRAGSAG